MNVEYSINALFQLLMIIMIIVFSWLTVLTFKVYGIKRIK